MKDRPQIEQNSLEAILTTKPCKAQAVTGKASQHSLWQTNFVFYRRKFEALKQPEKSIDSVNLAFENDRYHLQISIGQIPIQRFKELPSMLFEPLSFTEQEFDYNAIFLQAEEFIDRIYWVGGMR